MKKSLLFLIIFCSSVAAVAQDFSNKGKDFWVAYGYHERMTAATPAGGSQDMVLYFATDQVTTVTVSIPGLGWTRTYNNIPAGSVFTSDPMPKNLPDARLTAESTGPENKGIHITATKSIVAYAHIYNQNVSGATILFPTNTLGKEYYSINYTNNSNTPNANCWFYVVATDTGATAVEITPSAATINHPAGVTFTVNLTQGQVYNVMGQLDPVDPTQGVDLTGSKVKSVSTGLSGCKKIGVFSGSGRIAISCDGTAPSSDNYMVQSFPKAAWGKKYLTCHTGINMANNIYRICVIDPATVVTVDGLPIAVPLQNNFYYEIPATPNALLIEADQPITVAQYITSQAGQFNTPTCGNGEPGDPEVIYLSSVEQHIAKVLWNATGNFNITEHYFNVIIPNTGTGISSFKLDGVALNPALFTVHPQDPNYSYLIRSVSVGQHSIESDSGFNAIAYGFGQHESYGYNAGTNIKDLYNFLTPINPLSISPDPVACTGTPFYFSVTFPFQPTSLYWDFHNSAFLTPNTNVTINNPAAIQDSTYTIGTRVVYRYKLPGLYIYTPANSNPGYPVTITAGTTSTEGCGNSFERDFDLAVYDPPVAKFKWDFNGCVDDSLRFTDTTRYEAGTYSYKWYWSFGDGYYDSVRNPHHIYATPGIYTVKFAMISNVGCLSDTAIRQITVSPLPRASEIGDFTTCLNSVSPVIRFTGATGNPPFTFTYSINHGPDLTVTTAGTQATVLAPTSTAGTFNYILSNVAGSTCSKPQYDSVGVIVNPLPVGTVTGTATVCLNSAQPNITFTATTPTVAPYSFTYNINNGPNLTVTTNVGNSITVAAPTNIAGTFVYNLVSIQDASPSLCRRIPANLSATITVRPLPTASISGNAELCLNATAPQVTFTGATTISPYTFTYNINNGSSLTVTTTSGNSINVPAPTSAAGTFVYNLVSVQDASITTCSQAQNGTATVLVNPLPTAGFTYNLPSCTNRIITFNDASVPNAGNLNQWTWNFGDPSSGAANTSSLQTPSHTFSAPGTYIVKLTVKTDKGCQSVMYSSNVIVNPRPTAGFINPEVCLSDTYAQFVDTSTVAGIPITGGSYLWDFGDPGSGALNSSVLQNPQHSYSTIGTKNVVYIITSADGCKDTLNQSFFVNGDVPVAGVSVLNPNGLCANDSVAIQNTSTVDVGSVVKVDIYWDNINAPGIFETDDLPYPNKIYTHLYPNFQNPLTKNYTIRFRAYSGATCVDDKFQTITINAAPKVQFNTIPDTCLYITPFQLTEASETGGVPGSFVFTGPGVSSSGVFNPSLVGPGIYTIHYTFTSDKGCMDSAQKQIKVLAPPVANFGFSRPACETKTVTFTDSSSASPGTLTTWTWNFDDGTVPVIRNTGVPFTYTFPSARPYHVTLIVTTNKGCNSIAKEVVVNVMPQPRASFRFTDTACLPNARIEFRNTSFIANGSALNYAWLFGDPSSGISNSSSAVNPYHIYAGEGPYNVKLRATSQEGCFHDTIISVNTIHPQPKADFEFSKPGVCIGDNVNLIDRSDPRDGTFNQWYWDFGDARQSTSQNPLYTYADTGKYTIIHYIVNSFGCNSDTANKDFNVYPFPKVNAGPDLVVLEGEGVILQASATGKDLEYLWTKDGNITTGLYLNNNTVLQPVSSPINDMYYTLTVTSRGGCPISDQVYLKVLKIPAIPNTFSPNHDGINEYWEIKYLDAYPNAWVQVFTRTGQLVFEEKGGYKMPWDGTKKGQPLPVDTYYYIIEPESGRKPVTGYVTIIK